MVKIIKSTKVFFIQRQKYSFSLVAQPYQTLCDPMNCSTPGLPVHRQLPEFTQTHVHQVSDAIQPSHPLSSPSPPAPCPWDSPGKNIGVGCHFLLQCMQVKSESKLAQSRPTLREPMDGSLPGSAVHGIFQARVLEWGATAFSVILVS